MRIVHLKSSRQIGWDYAIAGFERSLARTGIATLANQPWSPVVYGAKALARLHLLRRLGAVADTAFLSLLLGPMESRLFPTCFFAESVVYCFDVWQPAYPWWENFFRRHKIRVAFASAQQSADYFSSRLPMLECIWLPEATDPSGYVFSTPLHARTIDVLELGRRHEAFHEQISAELALAAHTRRYELVKGAIVFPSRELLVKGLGMTKLSVVFPSSMTHPDRSGDVETATHKYFESIASKCVVLGRGPKELGDLFGYNPVIEVDWADPAGQIREILRNIDAYQPQVDANYARLLEVGTWDSRAKTLLAELVKRGYEI